jgi:hypothetical protein
MATSFKFELHICSEDDLSLEEKALQIIRVLEPFTESIGLLPLENSDTNAQECDATEA